MFGEMRIPRPYERLGISRAEQAAELGISESQLRRRHAKQRQEQEQRRKDLTIVPIVDEGSRPGYHYRLDYPEYSHLPPDAFRIGLGGTPYDEKVGRSQSRAPRSEIPGTQVVRADGDKSRKETEPKKEPAKFRPKRPRKKVSA